MLRGRYLIGADGASSTVRRWLGIERTDLGFNERWLDVDARMKRELTFDFDCGQICDPARPITVLPLGKRHRRWEWALLPGETIEEMQRPETAWRLLARPRPRARTTSRSCASSSTRSRRARPSSGGAGARS